LLPYCLITLAPQLTVGLLLALSLLPLRGIDLNNRLEGDHAKLKRLIRPSLGLASS
jgi:hypothetical protein